MTESKLESYMIKILPGLYEMEDIVRLNHELIEREPRFRDVSAEGFGLEFLALRLALACRSWEIACAENHIKDEASQKMLLRRIMNSFQSPKFLPVAEAFGDYFYSENAETHPEVRLPEHLFKRLKISPKTSGEEKPSDGFQLVVAVASGFRNEFENGFFEFINQA